MNNNQICESAEKYLIKEMINSGFYSIKINLLSIGCINKQWISEAHITYNQLSNGIEETIEQCLKGKLIKEEWIFSKGVI